jgi:hypothetical protein
MNNMKDIFNDPGLKGLSDNLMTHGSSILKNVVGGDLGKFAGDAAATGISAASPFLDKVIPGAGGLLSTASQHIIPGLSGLIGGLFKKNTQPFRPCRRSSRCALRLRPCAGCGD